MARLLRHLVQTLLALGLAAGLSVGAMADTRLALVIGVGEQTSEGIEPALGAKLDAEMVTSALRAAGYEVTSLTNGIDKGRMQRAVYTLADAVFEATASDPDVTVLVYFVGNAVQVSGRTYLLGTDAQAGNAITLSGSGLPADFLSEQIGNAGARNSVIVIDVATPTSVTDRFALTPGVRTFDAPAGGAVIISTQADQRAPARSNNVSTFALSFVEDMVLSDAPFRQAAPTMRANVQRETGITAWYADRTRATFTLGRSAIDRSVLESGSTRALGSSPSPQPSAPSARPSTGAPSRSVTAPPPPTSRPPSVARDTAPTAEPGEPGQVQTVTVFYGTDRTLEPGGATYGVNRSAILRYGKVEVSIPPIHKPGTIELPSVWKFEFAPDASKHFVMNSVTEQSEEAFVADMKAAVGAAPKKQALVFIHGFNTSFDSAAFRTAQLYNDLRYEGVPAFYAWPSRPVAVPAPWDYARDQTSADRTVRRLEEFLMRVRNETGVERIHVIAHSMGNHALFQALDQISRDLAPGARPPFDEIVMSAPDIDRALFLDVAPELLPTARRITIYASANDEALKVSRKVNGDYRVGDTAGGVILVPGIDYIDASNVRTELFGIGHDYTMTQATIISDIDLVLRAATLAAQRDGLRSEQLPPEMQVYYRILGSGAP